MALLSKSVLLSVTFVLGVLESVSAEPQPPLLKPVPLSAVDIRSGFWLPRQRINREKTIPHLIEMCEREGRVRNLLRAAGKLDGGFEGTRYHDADLFKVIEAASYTLTDNSNPELDRKLDELITAISAAQRADGYLHTYSQVRARDGERPTKLNLFAAGHLIHAGAAHWEATGKKELLRSAVRISSDAVYVNQYVASVVSVSPGSARLRITQKTLYPWDGQVVMTVEPQPSPWHGEICLRIPDWSRGLESTGGLYQPPVSQQLEAWTVQINGCTIPPTALRRGYLVLRRDWVQGDTIMLSLAMPILRIRCHPLVVVNRGRVALQRGPVVYCIEAVDHGGRTRDVVLPCDAALHAEHHPELLAGAILLKGDAQRQRPVGTVEHVRLCAVPYAVWGNREVGEMDVWLPEEFEIDR